MDDRQAGLVQSGRAYQDDAGGGYAPLIKPFGFLSGITVILSSNRKVHEGLSWRTDERLPVSTSQNPTAPLPCLVGS